MDDKRKFPRSTPPYLMAISHSIFGRRVGRVKNMSDGGVLIELDSFDNLFPSLLINAEIIGEGWDQSSPSLEMTVVRIDNYGVALCFAEPLKDFAPEEHLWNPDNIHVGMDVWMDTGAPPTLDELVT